MRRPTRQSLVVALASVGLVASAIAVGRVLSYTAVEVVFFAIPLGFVGFLCWQAAMYHVVRIGDDHTEWDAPLTGPETDDEGDDPPREPDDLR